MTKRMKTAIKFLPIPFLLLLFLLFLLFFKRAGFERISCPIPLKQLALYSGGTAWGLSLENEVLYSTKGLEEFQPVKILGRTDCLYLLLFIRQWTSGDRSHSWRRHHLAPGSVKLWQWNLWRWQCFSMLWGQRTRLSSALLHSGSGTDAKNAVLYR